MRFYDVVNRALWAPLLALLTSFGCSEAGRPAQAPSRSSITAHTAPAQAPARARAADEGEVRGRPDAVHRAHVAALEERIPDGFVVVVEPPFVVIGNGGRAAVERSARQTIRWAVERLERDFFARRPARILDIWLFADAASYRTYTKRLWGEVPDTPYGYYSSDDGVLVMNISTGGGTLVHEIVHPYVEANFPAAPAWFNEGLGSLFEQSSSRDGHIVGLTNWRLAGLQRAIRAGELPSFRALTATTTRAFYADDAGTNYAQARYLLYYLQERGQLVAYYHAFVTNQADDPTGYDTLRTVLELDAADIPAFERRWRRWILSLTFP